MTLYGEYLAKTDVKEGIFHGGSLSPLLFVICMITLSEILRKVLDWFLLYKCLLKILGWNLV